MKIKWYDTVQLTRRFGGHYVERGSVRNKNWTISVPIYRTKWNNVWKYGLRFDDCHHCKKTILKAIRGYMYVVEVGNVLPM